MGVGPRFRIFVPRFKSFASQWIAWKAALTMTLLGVAFGASGSAITANNRTSSGSTSRGLVINRVSGVSVDNNAT